MRNQPPYEESYSKHGGFWKIWSVKKFYFNVTEKQRETIFCTAWNLIVYQKNTYL